MVYLAPRHSPAILAQTDVRPMPATEALKLAVGFPVGGEKRIPGDTQVQLLVMQFDPAKVGRRSAGTAGEALQRLL